MSVRDWALDEYNKYRVSDSSTTKLFLGTANGTEQNEVGKITILSYGNVRKKT